MKTTNTLAGAALAALTLVAACGAHIDASSASPSNSAGATSTPAPAETSPPSSADDTASPTSDAKSDDAGAERGDAGIPDTDAGSDAGRPNAHPVGGYAGSCPAVWYKSHADITAKLPISVADATTAVFTACRNSECYSGKLIPGTSVLDLATSNTSITIKFDDAGPAVTFIWSTLSVKDGDEYTLSVASPIDQTPIAIFDTHVTYHTEISDPSLAAEGFAMGCSSVSVARVDLLSQ